MKNIQKLMKQAQQMQDNMRKMQEQLAQVEDEGQSGAGLVKVVATCRNEIRRISIDPSLLADDRDMLEDLVVAGGHDRHAGDRRVQRLRHRQRFDVESPPGKQTGDARRI